MTVAPTSPGNVGQRVTAKNITVLIPTVGRPEVERCMGAIEAGTVWPAALIVVDQGTNPDVALWTRRLSANGLRTEHIISAQRSAASARNCAIERITTRFGAAIDDDCIAARDWLERLIACLNKHPSALVTGRCLPAGDGFAPTIVASPVPHVHTRPSRSFPSPLASGNLGFALETARRIGPFDEHLAQAEDNDWAYRALRSGISVVYEPEVVVEHYHWRDDAQLDTVRRAYVRSQGAFYGKHIRHGDWWIAGRAVDHLARSAAAVLRGAATHDRARKARGAMRFGEMIRGLYAGLRGRGTG